MHGPHAQGTRASSGVLQTPVEVDLTFEFFWRDTWRARIGSRI